jgi:FimV-like protein
MTVFSKYITVVIILLASFPLVLQLLSPKMSMDEIFAINFSTEKIIDLQSQRGVDKEQKRTSEKWERMKRMKTRSEAIASYNAKKYPEAISLFKSYLVSNSRIENEFKIKLYLAKAYLADNNTLEAKRVLASIIKKGKKNIQQEAEWYMILTLIKEKNVAEVKVRLNEILLYKTSDVLKERVLKLQEQFLKLKNY